MSEDTSEGFADQPRDPPPPMFGLLIWDQGDIHWSFHMAMPEEQAREEFYKWDRIVGADNHRCYAIGIAPWPNMLRRTRYNPDWKDRVDRDDVTAAFAWVEKETRSLRRAKEVDDQRIAGISPFRVVEPNMRLLEAKQGRANELRFQSPYMEIILLVPPVSQREGDDERLRRIHGINTETAFASDRMAKLFNTRFRVIIEERPREREI